MVTQDDLNYGHVPEVYPLFRSCRNFIILFAAKKTIVDKVWLEQVIHRCLMCLGDLARYQLDATTGDDRTRVSGISQRYYHQALALQPNNGLPYNQLATLAVDLNFGLNSVFYYLRR